MPKRKKTQSSGNVQQRAEKRSRRGRSASTALGAQPRRGIQSVEIGLRVLAALAAEAEPAPLGSVAKNAGLSPSQTHRYLASLIASGMARQHPSSGRYELGAQAIQVGLAALARIDVFAEADPAIAAFTRKTGRTTLLAARGPLGPTIVRWHAGRMPIVTSLAIGSVLPFFNSATGYAFLAFMNDDEIENAIESERTSLTAEEIVAIRKRVRTNMFATVDELLVPGLRAVAVPILNLQGQAVLVATAMATPAFSREQDADVLRKLQDTCKLLTEGLGATWG